MQAADEPVEADRRRRLPHGLVARVGAREADVVGDGAREEERVLEHDPQLAAIAAEPHVAQVGAVDRHAAGARVVEARDQLRERRLATARLADERDAAACGHVDRDVVQHVRLAVGEADRVEIDGARDRRHRHRAGAIADLGLGVEHRGDLDHRRGRRLELAVHV